MRRSAAQALGEIGDIRAVEPLQIALKDEDKGVRGRSADALEWISVTQRWDSMSWNEQIQWLEKTGDSRVLEPFLTVLKNDDRHSRRNAIRTLVEVGKPAVKPLLIALKDGNTNLRGGAALALGKIGDTRAVEPLQAALRDDDKDVREAAEMALRTLKRPPVGPDSADSLEADSHEQVRMARQGLVAGNVLAMAIVYEGHVIEEPDPVAIAKELLTGFTEAGVLTGVTLHPFSEIRICRADESAWYSGNYEPGEELPQMLNEGIGLLRDRLLAAGQTMGRVNTRSVQLKGRSRVVSTCWVGIHILQD